MTFITGGGGNTPILSLHCFFLGNSLSTCFVTLIHIHLQILVQSSTLSLQGPAPSQVPPLATQAAPGGTHFQEAFPDHKKEKRLAHRSASTSLFACLVQENLQLLGWCLTSRLFPDAAQQLLPLGACASAPCCSV